MSGSTGGRGRLRGAVSAALPGAALALLLALVPGCGGCGKPPEYPSTAKFAPRADRLVLKLPDKAPEELIDPYKREEGIAALDALGGRTVDVAALNTASRTKLDEALTGLFGTPPKPTLAGAADAAGRLKLTDAHLAEGSRLYRRHCLQCHNMTGDGRGTSAATIPFPRDYRQGVFKFVTSGEGGKPRRADLLRTLRDGLNGTPMPSFGLLPEGERDLLAGYVAYLSARGQVEFESLKALSEGSTVTPESRLGPVLAEWEMAENAPPLPAEPDDGEPGTERHMAAVRRGYGLFTAKRENSCLECHAEFGRKAVLRYDVWGAVAKPANLTQNNVLKGGARPEDIYARVRFGIAAVGMPAHPQYSDREVWDLVRFVRSMPYPVQLPEDIRDVVHPK